MPSLDDLKKNKKRKSTQKITKAMKMVAAAKYEKPKKMRRKVVLIVKKCKILSLI